MPLDRADAVPRTPLVEDPLDLAAGGHRGRAIDLRPVLEDVRPQAPGAVRRQGHAAHLALIVSREAANPS